MITFIISCSYLGIMVGIFTCLFLHKKYPLDMYLEILLTIGILVSLGLAGFFLGLGLTEIIGG